MTSDRLQELLNLILSTDEITNETDSAHIEICEAFNAMEENLNKLELLQKELNFYRSIDFVSMGRFIEYDKGCDLSGWEFLANGWRDNNEAQVIWYVQQRWNKNYHYSDIFDENKDKSNNELRTLLSHYSHLHKMYKEQEAEIEELQAKLQTEK